ncbi:MAG: RnfH family protein [Casimicrobiaceae bacterium]|nr:RnfH family protein [Casimicrobiaceae bacterium]MCX8098023.1 RnfH family protein [Casimicrobiaceae bacterium]MDW8312449.1 RnfH family protein [Burkholderiales bacterium]
MRVEVVRAWPDTLEQWELELPEGATLGEALDALNARGIAVDPEHVGVWGRRRGREHPLAEGDRIELYRPITADPKAARLDRAKAQGRRSRAWTRRTVHPL